MLPQCASLVHLHLFKNSIGDEGVGRLAAVLPQCASLAHLNLSHNKIKGKGAAKLAAVLPQCASLVYLELRVNGTGSKGPLAPGRLATVQTQCPWLTLEQGV